MNEMQGIISISDPSYFCICKQIGLHMEQIHKGQSLKFGETKIKIIFVLQEPFRLDLGNTLLIALFLRLLVAIMV